MVNQEFQKMGILIILPPNNGFTVRITLPDGYFEKQKLKITIFDFIAICLPIILGIIAFSQWEKYGKDEKIVETIEFNPPDNMNSLDVAYAYKGKANSNDVVSLLANKGYIKIKVEETGSKLLKSKSYKIIEVKKYDGNDENERLFLERLFKNGTIYRNENNNVFRCVTKSDLEESFYTTVNEIIDNENTSEFKNYGIELRKLLFYHY